MATPTGITLSGPNDVIIEVSDDVSVNTAQSKGTFSGGYVRMIGANVIEAEVDDFVQYNPTGQTLFNQDDVTYAFTLSKYILFVQLPPS